MSGPTDKRLFPTLDDGPGPAPPLGARAAHDLVAAVMARHLNEPRPRRKRIWALTGALLLVSAAGAGAAYRFTRPAPPPPLEAPAPEPPPIPAPTESAAENTVPTAELPSPPPVRRSAPASRPVTDLLEQANRARARERWREAAGLYARAMRRSPGTQEAYAASIAAGSLYLEKLRDPRRALTLYRRALTERPTGALAEEARWGIAESHRKLRRKAYERKALETFLREHPDSLRAPAARERLKSL